MNIHRASSFYALPILVVVTIVGCTDSDPIGPSSAELGPADVRDAVVAYFDHLESVDVDVTNPVSVHHASVDFVEVRFADDPEQKQVAMTYLWNPEDADAVIDFAAPVSPTLQRLRDGFLEAVAGADHLHEVLDWIAARRTELGGIRGDDREAAACYLDLVERIVRFVQNAAVADGTLGRQFNLTKCVLSVLGGAGTGLIAGAGTGGAIGTVAGPTGTVVGAGIGGTIGVVSGAATGAAAGCF